MTQTPDIVAEPITVQPEFDFWLYAKISGESRLDHALLETLEQRWNEFKPELAAHRLTRTRGGAQYLLLYLSQKVEAVVDEAWKESPTLGLALHNLAVSLVMGAARELVPELEQDKCAPMPKPTAAIQDAFEALGLNWNADATLDRKYAVFTNLPYKGGCEICFLEEGCTQRKLAERWSKDQGAPQP